MEDIIIFIGFIVIVTTLKNKTNLTPQTPPDLKFNNFFPYEGGWRRLGRLQGALDLQGALKGAFLAKAENPPHITIFNPLFILPP